MANSVYAVLHRTTPKTRIVVGSRPPGSAIQPSVYVECYRGTDAMGGEIWVDDPLSDALKSSIIAELVLRGVAKDDAERDRRDASLYTDLPPEAFVF